MKKIFGFLFIAAACILCSCGQQVEKAEDKPKTVLSAEELPTETAAATEPATTPAATSTVSAATTVSQSTASTTQTTTETTTTTIPPEPDAVVIMGYNNVEVYSETRISDYISETNTELSEPDKLIDTSELGTKEVHVKYKYEGYEYERIFTYNVIDTTPPLMINNGWSPYVLVNSSFDLSSLIGYGDNYDRNPSLTYTGAVNTAEAGNYPITVTVTDSSGNYTTWDMTVYVVSEIAPAADNNQRISFSDFRNNYQSDNVRFGLDISEWQTYIDFNAVKNSGVDFVIMRMGHYYSQIKKDLYYDRNIAEAAAVSLDMGVYLYSTDTTEEGVREHARWMIDQLGGRQLQLPIAFDWEEFDHFQKFGISLHDVNNLFEAFADEIEKAGYTAMLYSSKNFLETVWENRNNRTVWLAHYTSATNYAGPYAIWQATPYGVIDGITGIVDMNIQYLNVPLE